MHGIQNPLHLAASMVLQLFADDFLGLWQISRLICPNMASPPDAHQTAMKTEPLIQTSFPVLRNFAAGEDHDLKKVGAELAVAGRARRRTDVQMRARAKGFAHANAEAILRRLAALQKPEANSLVRDMIRNDLLPEHCDIAVLKKLFAENADLLHYVDALEHRLDTPVNVLSAEDVLRQASNLFTYRLLGSKKRAELGARQGQADVREAKRRPARLAKAESATSPQEAADAYARLQKSPADYAAAKHLVPDLDNVIQQAIERARQPQPTNIRQSDEVPNQSQQTGSHASSRPTGVPKSASPDGDHQMHEEIPEGKQRIDRGPAPRLQPEGRVEQHLPITARADYKDDGQYFHLLGARTKDIPSEMQRFDQAVEAFLQLLNRVPENGQAPVFKHVPDLLHRVYSTHNSQIPEVETALEAIREGLRGSGSTLTATAQKLLAWMAIASDAHCLKLDDPAQVTMAHRNGRVEVQEIAPDGTKTWRPAGHGMLDVAYTTSLIASWFKNTPDVRFDSAALRNIGIDGPLYRMDGDNVVLENHLYLSMGKQRLRSLSARDYLHLPKLVELREAIHAKRSAPVSLPIDLNTLPRAGNPADAPVNLGNLTEIVWGSSHGNTAMTLYALHATGLIHIESQEAWERIRDSMACGAVQTLDTLLAEHVVRGPAAAGRTFVLTGGTLARRMGNDLIELQVRAFLRKDLKLDLVELQSTHNACFDAYWMLNRNKGENEDFQLPSYGLFIDDTRMAQAGSQSRMASLRQMNQLMNIDDPERRKDVRERLRNYIKPYYDGLQLYRVGEDGRTLISHDCTNRSMASALESAARADGYKIQPDAAPAQRAAVINRWFRGKVLAQRDQGFRDVKDLEDFYAATQMELCKRTIGPSNPLHAQIGGYDESGYTRDFALPRGIDRNVSGRKTGLEAYHALKKTVQLPLMKKVFQPFETYVATHRLGVRPVLARMGEQPEGARIFRLTGNPHDMARVFDSIVAHCLHDLNALPKLRGTLFHPIDPGSSSEINIIDPDALRVRSADVLDRTEAKLQDALAGPGYQPERELLLPLKANIVEAFHEMSVALKAWNMHYSNKAPEHQKLVDRAIHAVDAFLSSHKAPGMLARKELIDMLFFGPMNELFSRFESVFSRDARMLTDAYAQTRIALDSDAGSQENHQPFDRTLFGI